MPLPPPPSLSSSPNFSSSSTASPGPIIPTRAFSFYTCARLSKLCMGSSHRNNAPAPLSFLPLRIALLSLPFSYFVSTCPASTSPAHFFFARSSVSFSFFFCSIAPSRPSVGAAARPVLVSPNSHYPKRFRQRRMRACMRACSGSTRPRVCDGVRRYDLQLRSGTDRLRFVFIECTRQSGPRPLLTRWSRGRVTRELKSSMRS